MQSLTIKKVPDRLLRAVRQSAKAHHRSINSEVIDGLERTFEGGRVDPSEFLASVDAMRERLRVPKLTDQFLKRTKELGRP
jgi:plasmid stability protein